MSGLQHTDTSQCSPGRRSLLVHTPLLPAGPSDTARLALWDRWALRHRLSCLVGPLGPQTPLVLPCGTAGTSWSCVEGDKIRLTVLRKNKDLNWVFLGQICTKHPNITCPFLGQICTRNPHVTCPFLGQICTRNPHVTCPFLGQICTSNPHVTCPFLGQICTRNPHITCPFLGQICD